MITHAIPSAGQKSTPRFSAMGRAMKNESDGITNQSISFANSEIRSVSPVS